MTYTYEELKELNPSFHLAFHITDEDLKRVNALSKMIEETRQDRPVDGDSVICVNPDKGIVSVRGHLQAGWQGKAFAVCTDPYTPWVLGRNFTDVSGGYWLGSDATDIKRFEKVGTVEKIFQIWGHMGAIYNGAIRFKAELTHQRYYS